MTTPQPSDGFAPCHGKLPEVELTTVDCDPNIRVYECWCPDRDCNDFAHGKTLDECRANWNQKKGAT